MYAIKNCSQIVTCSGPDLEPKRGKALSELGILENGTIIVDGDIIRALGTEYSLSKLLSQIPEENIYDAQGRALIPGFVDSHTHVLFAGTRHQEFAMRLAGKPYLEILREGGGILNSTKAFESSSNEEILSQTRARIGRMLEYGTTTVEIKSGYGLSTEQEVRALQLIQSLKEEDPITIKSTFLGAHAIPPDFKASPQDYVRLVCNEMIPILAKRKLADFCDVFCEEGVFSVEDTTEIFQAAIDHGMRLRLHSDEIVALGGTELACAMGASSVDHLVAITDSGIEALSKSKTIANLLPGTAFSLKKKAAPARRMIDEGVAISLSTDCNPGSCYTESMPMIIALACLQMDMSVEEALMAATFNGACSLGIQETHGSLEERKSADMVLLNASDYRDIPYHFGVNPVFRTMRKGQWVDELNSMKG